MAQNLKDIKAIAYDIDGVATDGSIIPVGPDPEQLVRIFNAKDSFATRVAAQKGFIVAVISVTQLIYLSEVGGLILGSKIPVNIVELFVLFLERTIISLLIVAPLAHLIF